MISENSQTPHLPQNAVSKSALKFEYGFNSVNGIVKKKYYLSEIPFMHDKCDVWQVLPIVYVRQFIGLFDKNGKEIYNGDILKFRLSDNKLFLKVIKWNQESCRFSFANISDLEFDNMWDIWQNITEKYFKDFAFEIIGNIYENPELLKTTS